MITAISALSALAGGNVESPAYTMPAQPSLFRQMSEELNSVGTLSSTATETSDLSGNDLHDVMIQMEMARMQLGLVVEVRNRLLEGYQEIVRLQL